MGRDRKPSINQETSKIAFPVPRRASLASSFSLPSLSLSSRSKPTPSLTPLDTNRANGHPLDSEDMTSSYITPSISYPNALDSLDLPTRPASPLKPPSSPSTSVPLPSIRSLRSRFSLTSQDPPNLPGAIIQTPTNKRVTSRRFLPFGNSTPSSQAVTSTPSVPRKSLSDVFSLGRASTSSRFDSSSARSATPSSRSARSVTSAATMRGGWNHNPGYPGLAPPNAGVSSRPRSDDFTLTDLGYVIAIESGDDTVRRRPDPPPAEPPPRLCDSSQTIVESSGENLAQINLASPSTELAIPPISQLTVTQPTTAVVDVRISNSNVTNQSASTNRSRQSPVLPISIPPLPVTGGITSAQLEHVDAAEPTSATEIEFQADGLDFLTAAFPFTPVDDRSDVTSSTNNTPCSEDRLSRKNSHTIPPRLPSPSPQSVTVSLEVLPTSKMLHTSINSSPSSGSLNRNVPLAGLPAASASNSRLDSPTAGSHPGRRPSLPYDRSPAHFSKQLQVDTGDGITNPALCPPFTRADFDLRPSISLALGLVEEEPCTTPHSDPKAERSPDSSMDVESDGRGARGDKLGQLLLTFDSPVRNGEPSVAPSVRDLDRLSTVAMARRDMQPQNILTQSNILGDPSTRNTPPFGKGLSQDPRYLGVLDDDLVKFLSPHRLSPLPALSASEPNHAQERLRTPASASAQLPSGPLTYQAQSSPLHRPGSRLLQHAPTPSPSTASARTNDLLLARGHSNTQRRGLNDRNTASLNGSPMLSPKKLVNPWPWGGDQTNERELVTTPDNPARPLAWRSPSASATMTRKRSASFDLSGSATLVKDVYDPFAAHSNGPKRADWLGPRTAKAFAAAGLLDQDKDRSSPYSSVRSDTPGHRGAALNSWRMHSERNGGPGSGPGSIRSHSRLGSEVISPSFRSRSLAGGDSSPTYRRSSLDHTAPPSPVSTHRTLVSGGASPSQSQQSALQSLRERHELETEALLLALAGSKRAERDLRAENEELMAYIVQLESRITVLETENGRQERAQSRARERRWDTPPPSDIDTFDKRRQEILLGRSSTRGWNNHTQNKSNSSNNRTPVYGINRFLLSPNETPRSASVTSVRRSAVDTQPRSTSPSNYLDLADASILSHHVSSPTRLSLYSAGTHVVSAEPAVPASEADFEEWSEGSFSQPRESSPRGNVRHRLSSHSVISLLPQMPGSMSMLVHEQPGGEFSEDEISFGSASPSSITLVHPRNNTPKPVPANISPVTADFSFNSIPGSPRSLRLRPEEEMHLADLISLQGLEITDVIARLDG